MAGPSTLLPQLVTGNVGLTDGALIAALLNSAPVSDTGQVGIAVRVISSLGSSGGGLTDTQLRATPVPVSLASVPSHAVTNAGTFATQATLAAETTKVIGTVNIAAAQTIGVTGTFWQVTQPVSLASVPSHAVTNAGTFAVQVTSAPTTAVTGTFFQATQPVSDTTNDVARSTRLKPADTLAAVTNLAQFAGTAPVMKAASTAAAAADVALVVGLSPNSPVFHQPSALVGTTLSTSATTVTLTLASGGAGLFHYITRIEIVRVSTAAVTGSAVLSYTSTNLPGSWTRSAGNAIAIGATVKDVDEALSSPLKSSAANTATTIVAPSGGTGVQVRITVYYYTGP